jgi:hypothetical protein
MTAKLKLPVVQTILVQQRRTAVQMEKWRYPLHMAPRHQGIPFSPDEYSAEAGLIYMPILDDCSDQRFHIAQGICIYRDEI